MENVTDLKDVFCYVYIETNKPGTRIGIVNFAHDGYTGTNLDAPSYTPEQARAIVDLGNQRLGVPADVVESMTDGSMFGWATPAAEKARKFAAAAITR